MRILVLGGYGLIGSHVVRRLLADGHEVIGLGRRVDHARRTMPVARWLGADLRDLTAACDWAPVLSDARPDAIVNCAGVLQDGARDNVAAVQSAAMRALYTEFAAFSARADGTGVFVQISATRARADAGNAFMETKAEADAALAETALDWVILRPGLVLAPQAYGGTALLRGLAALPLIEPTVFADRPMRTVHVEDVADAVAACVDQRVPRRASYDLVEPDRRSFAEVVGATRAWLGVAPGWRIGLPEPAVWAAARLGDLGGWLGWRAPLRTTAVQEIAAGVDGDPGPWRAAGGPRMRSFAETFASLPSTVQERWFARLFILKPVVIAWLSAFWIVTGAVTFAVPAAAAEVLIARGMDAGLAMTATLGGAALDIVLGLGLLWRRWAKPAALGMVALTLAYLLGGTILAPDLWADPLGPLVKPLALIVLPLIVLAILEER